MNGEAVTINVEASIRNIRAVFTTIRGFSMNGEAVVEFRFVGGNLGGKLDA